MVSLDRADGNRVVGCAVPLVAAAGLARVGTALDGYKGAGARRSPAARSRSGSFYEKGPRQQNAPLSCPWRTGTILQRQRIPETPLDNLHSGL